MLITLWKERNATESIYQSQRNNITPDILYGERGMCCVISQIGGGVQYDE